MQIWSVGLNADGSFADDARAEIDVKDTPSDNVVTDILFDGPGQALPVAARRANRQLRLRDLRQAGETGRAPLRVERQRLSGGRKTPASSPSASSRRTARPLGGIALSYGYDADGNIDYGKCRETLWTTGEHLREGEDKEREFKGGARVVHGLQGNDKGNIRPANEPPYETWFVDNDGQYDDADFYSRVGDIAIYAPCDAVAAAAPAPP